MTVPVDALELARALIRRPSVTPREAGALDLLERVLGGLGFTCHRLTFSEPGTPDVENLYARIGTAGPNLCFAGHVDVVPPGDVAAWSVDPFAAEIVDGRLIGRGACDMKGAVACWVAAASRAIAAGAGTLAGSLSLLITCDEEGPARNGTGKVVEWLKARGERVDHCLIGEPTWRERVADTIKIGRRGSMNGRLTVHGTQGHAAYPADFDNPIPRAMRMLLAISGQPLDRGSEHFEPSRAETTTIDVGNPTANIVPARVDAGFNIRFNDLHTSTRLIAWIRERCAEVGGRHALDFAVTGESFLCPPGPWVELIGDSAEAVTGYRPALSTGGGISDARFVKDLCPVCELGLNNTTGHKVDEFVTVAEIGVVTDIYETLIARYLDTPPC